VASDPARGVLAYAAELDREESMLVTVELAVSFELVVRDLDAEGRARERARVQLGDSTYDVEDLVVDAAAGEAWVASLEGTVRAVDLSRGAVTETWPLGDAATAVAVAPGTYVATGTATGVICLRRRSDAALLQCVAAHDDRVSALAIGPGDGGPMLVSASWDGSVKLWSVPTLALLGEHRGAGSANAVALAPDGGQVAIGRSQRPPRRGPGSPSEDQRRSPGRPQRGAVVELWCPGTGRVRSCRGDGGAVTAVAWTRDGTRLLSGSWDRTIRLWNPRRCDEVARLGGFTHVIRDLSVGGARRVAVAAWSPDLEGRAVALLDLLYP
jgi:WD40 repeat protein